jgi:hypothetical protein
MSVLNFSILYRRDAVELRSYLRSARAGLAPGGILVLNVFGGEATVQPGTTWHRVTPTPRLPGEPAIPAFDYAWEVLSYDRGAHLFDCRIHVAAGDSPSPSRRQELRDAFRYEWRLWSALELVEACEEAGFAVVQIWRHTYDPSQGKDGVFLGAVEFDRLLPLEAWTAYIVACR